MNKQQALSILELSNNSTPEEIKKKYKQLSKKFHPDINKDENAEAKFKEINQAYQVLTKPQPQQQNFNPFQHFDEQFGTNSHIREVNDIHATIHLSFKESIFGEHKSFSCKRETKCEKCNGAGQEKLNNGCSKCNGNGAVTIRHGNMIFTQTCPECHGKVNLQTCNDCSGNGFKLQDATYNFRVPGGVVNGNTMRLGNAGHFAGQIFNQDRYSDVLIQLQVEPSTDFTIDNNDIIYNLELPLKDAVLGSTKTIPTLDGDKEISIPKMSKHRDCIKLPNLGVNRIGNQVIKLDVSYPDNIETLV